MFPTLEKTNNSGIYQIKNLLSGVVYIGSSGHMKTRWQTHLRKLRINKHTNKRLQSSYNLHVAGMAWETLLEFSILESMPASTKLERLVREEHWIQEMIAAGVALYNSRLFPTQEPGAPQTVSAETRQKLSRLNKGKHYSPATEFKKGLAPSRLGIEHTEKAKELIGTSSKAMWDDEAVRAKLMSSRQSDEFRSLQSERMKTAWDATRDQRIQTLNLPEVRALKSESATKQWNDERLRVRMQEAQNSFSSKLKRLVAAVGVETAHKISCSEWLQNEVQEHGIKGTATRLNVDRGTIRRWYRYHVNKLADIPSKLVGP